METIGTTDGHIHLTASGDPKNPCRATLYRANHKREFRDAPTNEAAVAKLQYDFSLQIIEQTEPEQLGGGGQGCTPQIG